MITHPHDSCQLQQKAAHLQAHDNASHQQHHQKCNDRPAGRHGHLVQYTPAHPSVSYWQHNSSVCIEYAQYQAPEQETTGARPCVMQSSKNQRIECASSRKVTKVEEVLLLMLAVPAHQLRQRLHGPAAARACWVRSKQCWHSHRCCCISALCMA